jgi:DNA-binding MarR family transcriptional regulator
MREVARHLRELIVATDDYRRAMAAGIDISTNEAAVLGELLHEGALSPTSIATRTGLTAGSATTLIDRLVSAGLVTRTPHPDDRRRVLVDLTPRGSAAIETMFSLFSSALDEALSRAAPHLADDSELRRSLIGLLREMAASLRTHADDPARIRASIEAAAEPATRRQRPTSA